MIDDVKVPGKMWFSTRVVCAVRIRLRFSFLSNVILHSLEPAVGVILRFLDDWIVVIGKIISFCFRFCLICFASFFDHTRLDSISYLLIKSTTWGSREGIFSSSAFLQKSIFDVYSLYNVAGREFLESPVKAVLLRDSPFIFEIYID